MKTIAAVARQPGADFAVEEVEIEAPRENEVLVDVHGVGLCHTDLVFRDQFVPFRLPAVLGHEGAGVVRAVGEGVSRLKPGDAVIIGFGSCGHCSRCDAGLPSYCREFTAQNYAGARPDGTTALRSGEERVSSHFFGQSSFAGLAIADERNLVKVDAEGLDLRILGPLACGLQTGAGSVLRSLNCPPGSSLAIFGGGPVGLAAVMAAAHRGCDRIALVEPLAARRDLALELGATEAIDPAQGDPAEQLRSLIADGFDFVLETSGNEAAMAAALQSLASHGMLGLVGVPRSADVALSVNVAGLITFGHRIIGIVEGDSDLHGFIPELIDLHRAGAFPFEKLVACFPLSRINEAVAAQARGDCVKAVLLP